MLDRKTYKSLKKQVSCVVLVVDVNGSELMFRSCDANSVGQFVRDVLIGSVRAIETAGGSIISFTGDGLIAAMPDQDSAATACWGIAHDFCKVNEYLDQSVDNQSAWPFIHQEFGLKIAMEKGFLEVNTICSDFLGEQPFLAGEPSIYASRLLAFGEGNRCLVGPLLASEWKQESLDGPFVGRGKHKGIDYTYYQYDLEELWVN